jgi:hypothetical protein
MLLPLCYELVEIARDLSGDDFAAVWPDEQSKWDEAIF